MTEPLFFKRPQGLTAGEIAALTGAEAQTGADLERRASPESRRSIAQARQT